MGIGGLVKISKGPSPLGKKPREEKKYPKYNDYYIEHRQANGQLVQSNSENPFCLPLLAMNHPHDVYLTDNTIELTVGTVPLNNTLFLAPQMHHTTANHTKCLTPHYLLPLRKDLKCLKFETGLLLRERSEPNHVKTPLQICLETSHSQNMCATVSSSLKQST